MSHKPTSAETTHYYRSVFRPGLFAGQVHWVTGGGSGIGRCVAHELASLGATVVLSGRTRDKLDASPPRSPRTAAAATRAPFDIRDEDAVKARAWPKSSRRHGRDRTASSTTPAASSPRRCRRSARGLRRGRGQQPHRRLPDDARGVHPVACSEHGGAIVNMTADFRNGMPGMGHSGAARAGMSNLTMTAAFEWARAGVRVNAVAPGWIASQRHGHLRRRDACR